MNHKFLIAHHDGATRKAITEQLQKIFGPMAHFTYAYDGRDAAFKLRNAPPNVVIAPSDLPIRTAMQIFEHIVGDTNMLRVSLLALQPPPDNEDQIENVVSGRLQFVENFESEEMEKAVVRALGYSHNGDKEDFRVRFFEPGSTLMREGEKGTTCFLVVRGRLKAVRVREGKEQILGEIGKGEFVGEMAFINGEPRVADVVTAEPTEAIEIPFDRLDHVLFRKPVWARALMKSLARRLKLADKAV